MSDNKFNENFWAEDDSGFAVVLERMKHGKHTLASLLTVFQERSAAEEEYARRLGKSAKTALSKEELHNMGSALDAFCDSMESQARIHLQLAANIRNMVEKPLSDLFEEQRRIRKMHETSVDKAYKAKMTQFQAVKKLEDKLKKVAGEIDSLSRGKLHRDEVKLLKLTQSFNALKQEEQLCIDKLRDFHTLWIKEQHVAFEEFQSMEEARVEHMKTFIKVYAEFVSNAMTHDIETESSLKEAFEKCDTKVDLKEFVKENRTGNKIPPYIPGGEIPVNTPSQSQQVPSMTNSTNASPTSVKSSKPELSSSLANNPFYVSGSASFTENQPSELTDNPFAVDTPNDQSKSNPFLAVTVEPSNLAKDNKIFSSAVSVQNVPDSADVSSANTNPFLDDVPASSTPNVNPFF